MDIEFYCPVLGFSQRKRTHTLVFLVNNEIFEWTPGRVAWSEEPHQTGTRAPNTGTSECSEEEAVQRPCGCGVCVCVCVILSL